MFLSKFLPILPKNDLFQPKTYKYTSPSSLEYSGQSSYKLPSSTDILYFLEKCAYKEYFQSKRSQMNITTKFNTFELH